MNNPFHRFIITETGEKVDVNMNTVTSFCPGPADEGATLTFINGERMHVNESARSVRGATRKTWPTTEAKEA